MEPQQQQQQQHQNQEDMNCSNNNGGKGGGTSSSSSYACRQSSTRWTPTTDQIRILKDLYYNYGVRSPTADQIQRISARLRQYGKIEGKNVFYWFQNHKARERQKKRFFSPDPNSNINGTAAPPPTASAVNPQTRGGGRGSGGWSGKLPPPEEPFVLHNKFSNLTPPGLCSSSAAAAGVMAVGQMGGYGYGSVTMEKNFRDCSISAGSGGGYLSPNLGWIAVEPYASPPCAALLERKSHPFLENEQEEEEEEGGGGGGGDEEDEEAPEIETLPLFPMHGDDHLNIDDALRNIKPNSDHYHHHIRRHGHWYDDVVMSTSRTSLELSLNSYTGRSPGPI
ncbi:hypothetical protein ACJRO7_005352 [Eucalyptus globulus]|uniref:Homeobox domain-containing protein n=1 Tax=Eucalyptus globulus TaxID=34317 RepID=A0ABD3J1Q3_EUCGL